jgi:predicted acylesterase/phospholipase RssA
MSKLSLAIALLLGSSLLSVSAEKCYAIAFGSGGESSAFQAGALIGLLQKVPAEQMRYGAVSGISGGAVNAVFLANEEKGNEQAAADKMKQFWLDAGEAKLFDSWFGDIASGLLFHGGIYDSEPMKKFLESKI